MKKIKREKVNIRICFLLALCGLLAVHPISADAKVKINKKSMSITVGDAKKVKITGTKKKIAWKSSKSSIAEVTSEGIVIAKKKGNATITAKVGSKKLKCKVTVKKSTAPSFLKGTWITASSGGHRVTFTKKYWVGRRIYGNIIYDDISKYTIKGIVKTSYGYFVKISGYLGSEWGYRWDKQYPGSLEFVETWNPSSMKGYSGSSSLTKLNSSSK